MLIQKCTESKSFTGQLLGISFRAEQIKPCNKSFIDKACSGKMARWFSTWSRSIKTQKKNLANIQPSWPHACTIMHMYWPASDFSLQYSLLINHSGYENNGNDHRRRVVLTFKQILLRPLCHNKYIRTVRRKKHRYWGLKG